MYKNITIGIVFFLLLFSVDISSSEKRLENVNENASAIVESLEAVFTQTDINNANYKETRRITILNKQGERYAHFYLYGDKFRELKDFSGTVKNASGTVIKKISKKDLIISSVSEQMASDAYSIIYECKIPTYPYTVEYTYQQRWKNGIISYPPFLPLEGYNQSLKSAKYTIEVPENMNLRYDSNFDFDIKDEKSGNKHIYSFSAKDIKAIEKEPLCPAMRDVLPRILIAPSNFCFDSFCGNMGEWKDYGLWVNKLLEGRDVLPEPVINKIRELVKDVQTEKEKVEILYKYLQDNSRYVSIQLGIGGFRPIEASSVQKSSFGDCKGLSNLMKAYLKAVGINSHYCEISMYRGKHLNKSFPNVSQTDHAILLVPLANDSIWLECTSQTLPFGYIHDDIAGHDALVITPDGGKICRLPTYSDTDNNSVTKLEMNISEDGNIDGKMILAEYLHAYASNVYRMTSKDREQVMNYVNRTVKFPKIQVDNIDVKEDKSSHPSCILSAGFSSPDLINKTGSRLFIPICPLNKSYYNIFSSNKRELRIQIENGFSEVDTIIFNMPEGYIVESMPKNISLKTPYGILETAITKEDGKIIYTQNIDIYSGDYDKTEYEDIKAFFQKILGAAGGRLVIKKI